MIRNNYEALGGYLEKWIHAAPATNDLDLVTFSAQDALIEAGMVQYKRDGWNLTVHQTYPDAPKPQFKLMIRKSLGVDTDQKYYDRFVLPSVLRVEGGLKNIDYILGYPNAGIPIAAAFVRLAQSELGVGLTQLYQEKIINEDGSRELGDIRGEVDEGARVKAVDDTTVGGATKEQGWKIITGRNFSYAGLSLIVERDPLGTELVRQRTGADVDSSMHWHTVVERAAKTQQLPEDALQRERDYALRLFEWNLANGNIDGLPDPRLIS